MSDSLAHLLGMLPADLVEALATRGVQATLPEARRVLASIISDGQPRPAPRVPVRREVRLAVEQHFAWQPLELVERVHDDVDGFVKYLFRSPDGALSEAVRIPLEREGTFSVCLSSQVGCAMRCDFCATGRLGLVRNLAAWEIVAAFTAVRDDTDGRLSGAVFMGQGEPFHNYDEVIQAAKVLSDPCGGRVSNKAITISTVGLIPQIRRFTAEGHKFRLIVSLHSALPERRKKLLPVAGKLSLFDLRDALRAHAEATHDRVTVAWTVMSGVNTGHDEVEALCELLEGIPVRLNLIDVNDARPDGYQRASAAEYRAFLDGLQALKAPIVRRYSGGANRHAACGMLAATRWAEGPQA
ncbi:MAG: 23S rRNA (adenine(2503)-C(2))-methyltransferase RlmN [Myxococcota bacterium]